MQEQGNSRSGGVRVGCPENATSVSRSIRWARWKAFRNAIGAKALDWFGGRAGSWRQPLMPDTGASLEDLGGPALRVSRCGVKEPHNPDVLQEEFMRSTGARIWGRRVWNASLDHGLPAFPCGSCRDPRERSLVKFLRNGCAGAGCWRFRRWWRDKDTY